MATKRKPEHSCEFCRTFGDAVRALELEKYRCGLELEVAEAVQPVCFSPFMVFSVALGCAFLVSSRGRMASAFVSGHDRAGRALPNPQIL